MKKEKKQQEEAIVPVEENEEIAPMAEQNELAPVKEKEKVEEEVKDKKPRQTFGQVLRRFVLAILRLIIIVFLIGGVGAAIYFGAPLVYESYIRPVEQNSSGLSNLEYRQSQSEIAIADLQTRLATLEAGQAANNTSITDIDTRVQSLEGADIKRNESLVELSYQTNLVRALELLSRARLFLYQSNFGLARLDVQAARNILAEMQTTAPESKQQDLAEAIFRLDLVLKNLPAFPVAASDDLDIAWQVLIDGYPVTATETPTPDPTATEETVTATLEPSILTPEFTPTPIP
jgi:hypothetical protein